MYERASQVAQPGGEWGAGQLGMDGRLARSSTSLPFGV
jgi:hypothetical protein